MMKFRRRIEQAGAREASTDEERVAWSAEIPGIGGRPFCKLQVEIVATPQGEGRSLSIRGRMHTRMAALQVPEGQPELPRGAAGGLPVQRWLGTLLARRETPMWLRRASEPLLKLNFHSWVEVRASTAPLAQGADALMPESEQLKALGVQAPAGDGPVVKTWAGEKPGPARGYAQVSLIRLDKRHLPAAVATLLGREPLQIAGAIVHVVEEEKDR